MHIARLSWSRRFFAVYAASALLMSVSAHAVVNLKNGNFYVAFDDIAVSSGSGLKLSRHYNSLTEARGWFGVGWGTEFETRLFVMPDGLVAVRENGNAHVTLYGEAQPAAVQQAVERIVQTLRQKDALKPADEGVLRQQLQDDPLLRLQWAERYQLSGTPPTVGTRLRGAEYQSAMDRFAETSDGELLAHAIVTGDRNATLLRLKQAYITAREDLCAQLLRTPTGFERGTCSNTRFGDQQSFDAQGRLTQLNVEGHSLRLGYGASRHPERILDEAGQSIELKWNERGFVSQVSGMVEGKPEIVDYSYDATGNLTVNATRNGNTYRHAYDNRHNMTAILYADETRKVLEYDHKNRVIQITQRDGTRARFGYETNTQGDTETVYSSVVGDTLRERRRISYNRKGQLLKDLNGSNFLEYEYHPTLGTVTHYRANDADCRYEYNRAGKVTREVCPEDELDSYFDYDDGGNVTKATIAVPEQLRERLGSKSYVLVMRYDTRGRLTQMNELGERWYVIKSYANDNDEQGQPQMHGFPEGDPIPRARFGNKAGLMGSVLRNIDQRTRIVSGFVMVRE